MTGTEKEITIEFGTLFTVRGDLGPDKVAVVLDIGGEGDDFFFAPTREVSGKRVIFAETGIATIGPGYIQETVGQLSLEQVISAIEENDELPHLSDTLKQFVINSMIENSKKGTKTITIST